MDFATFEPVYEAILADFGFERKADERARDVAVSLALPMTPMAIGDWQDQTVAVAGAAPTLIDDVALAREADVVVAASTAADTLLDAGVAIDCQVTDLDKRPQTGVRLTKRRVPVVVHAHGDNIPAIREWLPRYESRCTLVTTQVAPSGPVVNLGGFTDGDRAAFLADHLGAERLVFPGWTFDDPTVDPMKARKLRWAARLLAWLERRRDDHFDVLDGWRDWLDDGAPIGAGRWRTDSDCHDV